MKTSTALLLALSAAAQRVAAAAQPTTAELAAASHLFSSGNAFAIRSLSTTGSCYDDAGGTTEGTAMTLQPCDGSVSQQFRTQATTGKIESVATPGLCLQLLMRYVPCSSALALRVSFLASTAQLQWTQGTDSTGCVHDSASSPITNCAPVTDAQRFLPQDPTSTAPVPGASGDATPTPTPPPPRAVPSSCQ